MSEDQTMSLPTIKNRYDVVIAGARVAGAATAMLLARRGLAVLVVDPSRRGSDTLSTHALMRGGVLQLARWGVLDEIRDAGTPPIRTTTFSYGDESVEVEIKPRDGIDALYSPRRTVLDEALVAAAERAGAEVVHGLSLEGLVQDDTGRVRGAFIASPDRTVKKVEARLVIGADGRHSRVARHAGAEVLHLAPNATANIYGHVPGLDLDGYHWFYADGVAAGVIPTNDGEACVFAGFRPSRFHAERSGGLEPLFLDVLTENSEALGEMVRAHLKGVRLRAFAGAPGVLRRAVGPGWALVGDSGYFKDPCTAHGITDALRDAELLARAAAADSDEALVEYEATRNRLSMGMIDITDRLASLEWSLGEAKELHLRLSREMAAEAEYLAALPDQAEPSVPVAHELLRSA